jgi:5-methylcytosine-specific restriction endonuclease McrA
VRREFSRTVRDRVLIHCAYRCEVCGSKSDLELHHRGHRADNSGFNAQVLCSECHETEHRRRDRQKGVKVRFGSGRRSPS